MAHDEGSSPRNDDPDILGSRASHQPSSGRKQTTSRSRVGLAHLGFRAPDVTATLARARSHRYNVISFDNESAVRSMALQSWSANTDTDTETTIATPARENERWQGGFEALLARIGFVEDPDG